MEARDSYAFPLYHRIGQAARSVIASRYWVLIILLVAVLLYLPFLSSGFFQDDYGFRIQFSSDVPEEVRTIMRNSPWNLYGFSGGSSTLFRVGQERGFVPWWASDQIKTSFFLPLSSLTLALDYSLWPDTPLLLHIHSLLWFCLLIDVAKMKEPAPLTTLQRVLLRITVPLLLISYLVVSPIVVLTNPASARTMSEEQARVADFGSAPELAQQHLYVINPPGTMVYVPAMLQRLFTDEPFPASINYLSSGFAPVRIERVDARTIVVTPAGGYTPLPGPVVDRATGAVTHIHLENVYRALDESFYNPRDPMQVGQVVALSEVTVEVTEMAGDGRIAQAAFTFAHPLEDARYVWLLWDAATSTYQRVAMPPVGESRIYP